MKIAININELTLKQTTGVKVYTREIVKALGKIDEKNKYSLYCNAKKLPEEYSFLNYSNFELKKLKSNYPFWTYTKLAQTLKRDKPDVLFMPIQSVPFLNKPKNIKIVTTVHDLAFMIFPNHFTTKDKFLLKLHTKRAVEMSDKIIVPSKATKNDIIKFYNIKEDKIKVVYHGVNNDFKLHISKFETDNPYLLFVGQIQPRKNIIRLIEAFEIIKNRRDKSLPCLKLAIIGGKGWMSGKILERAKKSKFAKDIALRGKISDDDLAKVYQNASIFILPSLYEGFGLPVLEAMSYGIPCIVSNNSSLVEIVDDHALLVDAYSSDDIAHKIGMLLNNEFLRKDFSERSLKNIKRFSWEKSAKQTLEVFENVISDN